MHNEDTTYDAGSQYEMTDREWDRDREMMADARSAMCEAADDHVQQINEFRDIVSLMANHPAIDHKGVAEVEADRKARLLAAWNRDAEVDA